MGKIEPNAVHAVLFDVYGTLFEIGDRRAPYRQLLRLGVRQGCKASKADMECLMSQWLGLEKAAGLLGIRLTVAELLMLESELAAELASITPFADALPALHDLRSKGYKIGVCSNLAQDYAAPVLAQLPFELDACSWSFEAGAIKPAPAIYAHACQQLGCAPANVLMIGDKLEADVTEPGQFGMQALLLDRKQRVVGADAISGLSELCTLL